MLGTFWKNVTRLAGGGLAALLLSAGVVHAQAPDKIQELMQRLERQEQIINQLLRERQNGQTAIQSEEGKDGKDGKALDAKSVEKIVADYLKKKDAEKKKADEKKKKEDEDKGYEVGSDLTFKASWKSGLQFETANKDFAAHVGGRFHCDWGWFNPNNALQPRNFRDGADFRRARLRVDGTCWEVVDWVAEVDFASGVESGANTTFTAFPVNTFAATDPVLTDFYFDIKHLPFLGGIRTGHFKEPFSLEDYGTSSRYLTFLERSASNDAFSPARNIGIMAFNNFEETICWAAGFFRSNSANASGNVFDYGDGEYAYTSRVVAIPWYEHDGRCVLLFGGAYSYRFLDPEDGGTNGANASRARFASRIPLRVGSPTVVDTSALIADNYSLLNGQALLIAGPFSVQSEYYNAQVHNVRRGTFGTNPNLRDTAFEGWYIQASYFLTGEHRGFKRPQGTIDRVKVNEPFFFVKRGDPDCREGYCRGRGAWEIAARYDYLDVGSPTLAAIPGAGSGGNAVATRGRLEDIIVGVNWYLNPNFKVQFNYIHAWVDGTNLSATTRTGQIDALGIRFACDF